MSDPMNRGFEYKHQHPDASYEEVALHKNVPKTRFYERWNGIHAAHGVNATRKVSDEQERVLITGIESYGTQGTLVTSRHVHELAEAMSDGQLGRQSGQQLCQTLQGCLTHGIYAYEEDTHPKADVPKTRQAFYNLVSHSKSLCSNSDIYR